MQMRRVLPNMRIVQLEESHPIFDSFFKINQLNAIRGGYEMMGDRPMYLGIFENNDPKRRLIALLNYNNDLGESWEYSGTGFVPVDISNEAYKLMINYIVYAFTH
jgi:hypothetical protein